jgi:hypothetical protein
MRRALFGVAAAIAMSGAAAQATPYTFTLIAQTGAVAGTFGTFDQHAAINNGGTVAFGANIHTLNQDGIYTGSGGPTSTVVQETVNADVVVGGPVINNAGQTGFFATIGGTGGFWRNTGGVNANLIPATGANVIQGQPAMNDSGIAAGHVQVLGPNTEGIYVGAGAPAAIITQPIGGGLLQSPGINAGGQVAFTNIDGNGNRGIFLWSGGVPVQIMDVTGNGLGLQTGAGADIWDPRLNDSGEVVFHGRTTSGDAGIFKVSGGAVSQVALAGAVGGDYGSFDFNAAINNAGDVAFLATVIGQGEGIFTGGNPLTDAVIRAGDSLFGATVLDLNYGTFGLNDNGGLAFWALLDDGRQVIVRADAETIVAASEPSGLALLGAVTLLGIRRLRRAPAA